MDKISYGKQWIDEEDIEAVVNVLKGDFLTQGPAIDEFERKFAEYAGTKYAVAFCNGTAALHGAYFAAGLGAGDELITTPMTFAATSNAALYLDAMPIFVDIDKENYCIDISKIKEKITTKTKIIAPVSFGGYPVDIDKIRELIKDKDIVIVEDGAHALGAKRKGKIAGSQADMTMFSFHPVKHITTGEGGIITTDNINFYNKMKMFRSHGITKDDKQMSRNDGGWYYEMQFLGYNYRMTDMQAALGIAQLSKAEKFVKRRREIAKMYNEAFRGVKGLVVPPDSEANENSYHLYPLLTDKRDKLYEELKKENIYPQVNYIPVHLQPYYRDRFGYKEGDFPIAEKFYKEELSIPMYPKLTNDEVSYIIQKIIEKITNL